MDHQWIHVDVEHAKAGPFGAPIAHGHLTLSIMGHLPRPASVAQEQGRRLEGRKLVINYGFNRVRFPAPVPVGSRVRTQSTLKTVEIKGGMIEVMSEVVMEVEGQEKPLLRGGEPESIRFLRPVHTPMPLHTKIAAQGAPKSACPRSSCTVGTRRTMWTSWRPYPTAAICRTWAVAGSVFSRAIGVADAERVRHGVRPTAARSHETDVEGIEDFFLEKASSIWYWHDGKWLQLAGSD